MFSMKKLKDMITVEKFVFCEIICVFNKLPIVAHYTLRHSKLHMQIKSQLFGKVT